MQINSYTPALHSPYSQKTVNYTFVAQKRSTLSFGTNDRTCFSLPNCMGIKRKTATSMFRDDMYWGDFAVRLNEHFKDLPRVNIINHACSDGSEPYTLAISLIEELGAEGAKKFFPIIAKDKDKVVIDFAKNGLINLSYEDREKLESKGIDINKYFTLAPVQKSISKDNCVYETCSVSDDLRECVQFERGNILKDLKALDDDSPNTVLLFRNALPYLNKFQINKFLKLADKKLGENSILSTGEFGTLKAPHFVWRNIYLMGFKDFIRDEERPEFTFPYTFIKSHS